MTHRLGSEAALLATDGASDAPETTISGVDYEIEERNGARSANYRADRVMVTSLCAAFSNVEPLLPPVVRHHSSRWRIVLSVVIGIMTFSASFAHLRYMMRHGTDRYRRVQERNPTSMHQSLRFYFGGGNKVQPTSQLRATTEKDGVPTTSPRVLLGATITSWTLWGVMVVTHPFVKRRSFVSVGDGSEHAIITCIVFIIACILTHWTRIRYRYGEAAPQAVK